MQSINHQCIFSSENLTKKTWTHQIHQTPVRWTLPSSSLMQSLLPFPHFSQLPVLPKISHSRFANSVSGAACSFCPSRSCVTCPNISAKSGKLIAHCTTVRRRFVLKNKKKRVSCRICAAALNSFAAARMEGRNSLGLLTKVPSLSAVCRRLRCYATLPGLHQLTPRPAKGLVF